MLLVPKTPQVGRGVAARNRGIEVTGASGHVLAVKTVCVPMKLGSRLAMIRSTFIAAVMAVSGPALADSQPMGLPDFSIEKSCAMFAAHPRPLVVCAAQESHYRGEVTGTWPRAPVPGREKCAELASRSERGKYEVLARCLRTSISEAAWKDAVGTIKP